MIITMIDDVNENDVEEEDNDDAEVITVAI